MANFEPINAFLEEHNLGHYAQTFRDAEFDDFETFFNVTEDELKELGIALGPRKKMLMQFELLQKAAQPKPSPEHSPVKQQLPMAWVVETGNASKANEDAAREDLQRRLEAWREKRNGSRPGSRSGSATRAPAPGSRSGSATRAAVVPNVRSSSATRSSCDVRAQGQSCKENRKPSNTLQHQKLKPQSLEQGPAKAITALPKKTRSALEASPPNRPVSRGGLRETQQASVRESPLLAKFNAAGGGQDEAADQVPTTENTENAAFYPPQQQRTGGRNRRYSIEDMYTFERNKVSELVEAGQAEMAMREGSDDEAGVFLSDNELG